MERSTLKQIGDVLKQTLPLEDTRNSKELRRLLVQLERRQMECDRKRDQPPKRKSEPH
jgi:hypothetical protein